MNLKDAISLITGLHGEQPSSGRLYLMVLVIFFVGAAFIFYLRTLSAQRTKEFYGSLGVSLKKIAKTAHEMERKTFHLTGLLVPILYEYLMRYHRWTQLEYSTLCWTITTMVWIADSVRVLLPNSMSYFPYSLLSRIIRDKERHQLSGTSYFGLGCTLAISFFPPAVAIVSIMWLVLGDMSAALIGVSIGGETVALKMGREGKKSAEGSIAMFISCFTIGMAAFAETRLAEYAICIGALVATFTELYEPFGLNDNITIPVVSCFALQWALSRIENC